MDIPDWGIITSLVILFYALGKSADLIILNIRMLGDRLGVNVFFSGLILGFLTSLPEFSIGINAVIKRVENLSIGNLFGGILVLFGLVLGGNLIIQRKIVVRKKFQSLLPIIVYALLPFLLAIDGTLSVTEGSVLILLYFFLVYHLYLTNKTPNFGAGVKIKAEELLKKSFLLVLGLILLIVISNLIVNLTTDLLQRYQMPIFLVGLIAFSLGTNLPEIIVMLRSWFRHIRDLSLANIIGSAMANVLIVGVVAFLRPVSVQINAAYYLLLAFVFVLLVLVDYFYENDFAFTRREGFVLLAIYLLFLFTQLGFFVMGPTSSWAR